MAETVSNPLPTDSGATGGTDTGSTTAQPLASSSLKGWTTFQQAVNVTLPTALAQAKATHAETLRVLAGG